MCDRACLLTTPLGAVVAVVGVGAVADLALALSGHDTLSIHAGRHPRVTLVALVGLLAHFNASWLTRALTRREPA